MKKLYIGVILFTSISLYGAVFGPDRFKYNPPIFYTACAEPAYQSHKHSAHATINVYYNGATVVLLILLKWIIL